jgi:tetratricopeptide (TPR) repeat protein
MTGLKQTSGQVERDMVSGRLVGAAMALLLIAHVLSLLLPNARLWGINHLLFLPDYCTYGYLVLGAIGLALLFKPIGAVVGNRFERAAGIFESQQMTAWLIFAGMALVIFRLLRMPVNLLGDGYSVANNIGGNLPVVFKWSEALAIKIVYLVSRLLSQEGVARGANAYAIVSVVSGAATVFFFQGIAYELGRDKVQRLLILCLLLFSGWTVLFFGYAENYPVLWPFASAYIYFAVRYMSGKSGLLMPSIILPVAIALHMQMLFFMVSYPFLLISGKSGAGLYRRHRKIFWWLCAGAATGGMALVVYKYNASFGFQVNFLPPFQGRPATPQQAMFSPQHWLDIANEFSLLIPLWPVLLLISGKNVWRGWKEPINRFLAAFSIGGMAFAAMVDPRLGMGRDWDLFALIGLGPVLLLARNIDAEWLRSKAQRAAAAFLALVLVSPFLATVLTRQPSISYLESLLRLDRPRSQPGMVMLSGFYRDNGNRTAEDSLYRELARLYPGRAMAIRADSLAKAGRVDEAKQLAESLYQSDPFSPENISLLGVIYLKSGNINEAKTLAEKMLEARQYDTRAWLNLASAYHLLGKPDSNIAALRQALRYSPQNSSALIGLVNAFHDIQKQDSSLKYIMRYIELFPDNIDSYYVAGMTAYQVGQAQKAKALLSHYVEAAAPGPNKTAAEKVLEKLP